MTVVFQAIRTSMAGKASAGQAPRWGDLLAELVAATSSPLTAEVERLLLEILRFGGELQLNESSPMPHRMSPENMLKTLALKALGRWTGATYLPTMRRLAATASPASFACAIRGVIQKVIERKRKTHTMEAVLAPQADTSAPIVEVEYGICGEHVTTESERNHESHSEFLAIGPAFGMNMLSRRSQSSDSSLPSSQSDENYATLSSGMGA